MPYHRRRWTELRGDRHDHWSEVVCYFWVWNGVLEQQAEVYDSGVLVRSAAGV